MISPEFAQFRVQSRLNGSDNTTDGRLFLINQNEQSFVYEIQPVTSADNGTRIDCVVHTPLVTLVSPNNITLAVLRRSGIDKHVPTVPVKICNIYHYSVVVLSSELSM